MSKTHPTAGPSGGKGHNHTFLGPTQTLRNRIGSAALGSGKTMMLSSEGLLLPQHVRSAHSYLSPPHPLVTLCQLPLLLPAHRPHTLSSFPSYISPSAASRAHLLTLSSMSPKHGKHNSTKLRTGSQRLRLTGCWVILRCWDRQLWAPKSRERRITSEFWCKVLCSKVHTRDPI